MDHDQPAAALNPLHRLGYAVPTPNKLAPDLRGGVSRGYAAEAGYQSGAYQEQAGPRLSTATTTVQSSVESLGVAVGRLEKVTAGLVERLAHAGVLRVQPQPSGASRGDRPSYGGQSELACRIDARTVEIDQIVSVLNELGAQLDV